MLQTHKIALDPNNVQATQFVQHCGYARVAYNHVLADFKEGLDNGEWRSHIDLNKRFNSVKHEQYEWCHGLNQRAAHNAIYYNFQDAIIVDPRNKGTILQKYVILLELWHIHQIYAPASYNS